MVLGHLLMRQLDLVVILPADRHVRAIQWKSEDDLPAFITHQTSIHKYLGYPGAFFVQRRKGNAWLATPVHSRDLQFQAL
jgi:hypothetical protein